MKEIKFKKTVCDICKSKNYKKMFTINRKINITIVKCKNCGLIYMNPAPKTKDVKELYGKDYFEEKSDLEFNFFNPENYPEIKKIQEFLYKRRIKDIENTTKLKQGRILDIGCSFGFFLKTIKQTNAAWDVYGFDVSDYAIKIAKKNGLKNVIAGNIDSVHYPDNYFDVITLYEVIEHMKNPLKEFKKINSITKTGGYVVIQTGNLESLTAKIRGRKNTYFQLGHLHYFSKKSIKKLLESTGFNLVKIKNATENLEMAKHDAKIANTRDYINLFIYNFFNKLHVSGGMTCYAKKVRNL